MKITKKQAMLLNTIPKMSDRKLTEFIAQSHVFQAGWLGEIQGRLQVISLVIASVSTLLVTFKVIGSIKSKD